jgi:hypothetical protein
MTLLLLLLLLLLLYCMIVLLSIWHLPGVQTERSPANGLMTGLHCSPTPWQHSSHRKQQSAEHSSTCGADSGWATPRFEDTLPVLGVQLHPYTVTTLVDNCRACSTVVGVLHLSTPNTQLRQHHCCTCLRK